MITTDPNPPTLSLEIPDHITKKVEQARKENPPPCDRAACGYWSALVRRCRLKCGQR